MSTIALFPRAAVEFEGELKGYEYPGDSGNKLEINFCPVCGAPVMLNIRKMPDAVLLIGNSEDLLQVVEGGSLARAVDLPRHFLDHGWTHKAMQRWRPLIEPLGPPAVDPEKVIVVLGRADDLVPVEGGRALVRRWRIPDGNVYLRRQGHFSVALGMGRDPAPLDRLTDLLQAQ